MQQQSLLYLEWAIKMSRERINNGIRSFRATNSKRRPWKADFIRGKIVEQVLEFEKKFPGYRVDPELSNHDYKEILNLMFFQDEINRNQKEMV